MRIKRFLEVKVIGKINTDGDKKIAFLIIFIYHNIFNEERNKIFRYKN